MGNVQTEGRRIFQCWTETGAETRHESEADAGYCHPGRGIKQPDKCERLAIH